MKNAYTGILLTLFAVFFPLAASAHQPRIVDTSGASITVEDPETSKAYYGRLNGKPQIFQIEATEPFKFYMNILVPDVEGVQKDISVALIDIKHLEVPVAVLDGIAGPWVPYHEDFAQDDYFKGPEFKATLPVGVYQVAVWSPNNEGVYTLAIGEAESFGPSDILNAYSVLPKIKPMFFGKPAFSAYFTPILGGPILLILVLAGGFLVWRQRKLIG